MPDERERLRAIAEHPEDPAPRRAYADWLAAQGGPRGEDIRAWREQVLVWDPRWRQRFTPGSSYCESLSLLGFASYAHGFEGLPDRVPGRRRPVVSPLIRDIPSADHWGPTR